MTYFLSIKSHGIKRVTSVPSAAVSGSRPLLPASKRGHGSKLACTVRAGERPWTRGESRVLGPSSPGYFRLCYWLGEHERAARGGEAESLCWHISPALHSVRGLPWLRTAGGARCSSALCGLSWSSLGRKVGPEELRPAGLPGEPQNLPLFLGFWRGRENTKVVIGRRQTAAG